MSLDADLFEIVSDALLLSGPDRVIVRASRAARALIGEEIEGRRCFELIGASGEPCPHCPAQATDQGGRAATAELKLASGPPVRIEAYPAPQAGSEEGWILDKIIPRHSTQNPDQRATDFVSVISHELQTPLTTIRNVINLISDSQAGEPGDEQKRLLAMADESVSRLAHTIRDLLDLSRIDEGRLELRLDRVDLREVIERVITQLGPQIEKKEIRLSRTWEAGPLDIFGDPDLLERIFMNIIGNALKFTGQGGHIQMRLFHEDGCGRRLAPAPEPPGRMHEEGASVRAEVEDDGVGIPPEELEEIFEKFHQAAPSKGEKRGGAGLGLTIARELIEAHQGRIRTRSTLGKGSTFSILFPAFRPGDLLCRQIDQEIEKARRRERSFSIIIISVEGGQTPSGRGSLEPLFERIEHDLRGMVRRTTDRIDVRQEGSEIISVLMDTTAREALALSRRIEAAIDLAVHSVLGGGEELEHTLHVANYPHDGTTREELLACLGRGRGQ